MLDHGGNDSFAGDAGIDLVSFEALTTAILVDLPAGVDLSAYRIVQEALTNTLKHAGPAQAWVNVRYVGDDDSRTGERVCRTIKRDHNTRNLEGVDRTLLT